MILKTLHNWFKSDIATTDSLPEKVIKNDDNILALLKKPFIMPSFEQAQASPGITQDNGFIGNQLSPKSAFGFDFDAAQLGFFAAGSYFIGYPACAMAATNWIIDKACNMPARDAIRHGYIISSEYEEISNRLRSTDRKYGINKHLREMIHFGRVYGGRIVLFNIASANPEEFYKNPFNMDGVQPGTYKGLSQIDPNWIEPVLNESNRNNPASQNYYEPEFWRIGNRLYHRSHLHIYVPYPVPDFLKPTYRYLGVSVPQRVLNRAYQAERSANESTQLLMTKRLVTLAVSAASLANKQSLIAHTELMSMFRDNYGIYITGSEEAVAQHETALSDVDSVIMNQYQLVAAAANVPATKLLETQPKGFNASGDYEESVYRESLESIQANDIAPLLEKHYTLVAKSDGITLRDAMTIQWNPLDSPTAKEWAEIENIKAQRDVTLSNTGAIDAEDIRNRLRQDKDSDYYNIEEGQLRDIEREEEEANREEVQVETPNE